MMKRTLNLLAVVAICSALMVSCKNTKTTEPTPEEIQAQKVALADSVLAQIDELAEKLSDAMSNSFYLSELQLNDAERLIKPDYLLDLSLANTLVTKSQKINALAMYVVDYAARVAFDMPGDEAKEVISKLGVDINHPIDLNYSTTGTPLSELIKRDYKNSKENEELAIFWQFQYAIIVETIYIISHNVDLFFSQITEDQWQSLFQKFEANRAAIEILAEYDLDMSAFKDFMDKTRVTSSDKEREDILTSIETSKHYFVANKEKQFAIRNALLQ